MLMLCSVFTQRKRTQAYAQAQEKVKLLILMFALTLMLMPALKSFSRRNKRSCAYSCARAYACVAGENFHEHLYFSITHILTF